MVVVIAILGILAAIAIPRLSGFTERADRSVIETDLRTIESAAQVAFALGDIGKLDDVTKVADLQDETADALLGTDFTAYTDIKWTGDRITNIKTPEDPAVTWTLDDGSHE